VVIAGAAGRMGRAHLCAGLSGPCLQGRYGLEAPSAIVTLAGPPVGSEESFPQRRPTSSSLYGRGGDRRAFAGGVNDRKATVIGRTGFSPEPGNVITHAR